MFVYKCNDLLTFNQAFHYLAAIKFYNELKILPICISIIIFLVTSAYTVEQLGFLKIETVFPFYLQNQNAKHILYIKISNFGIHYL